MKKAIAITIIGTVALCGEPVWAANSVVVPSRVVYANQQGAEIRVRIENDIELAGVTVPLAIREVSPGSYITSLKLSFGDRLTLPGGPISGLVSTWQVSDTVSDCAPNGFGWNVDFNDTLSHPVLGSPMGLLFGRAHTFVDPLLPPGSDPSGSFLLTVDVTGVPGDFEIDTSCISPAHHLAFTVLPGIDMSPAFTKGTISIEICDCPHQGDPDQDGYITAIDLALYIDCLFSCPPPLPTDCPDYGSPQLSDLDCDGFGTAIDLALLIDHLFDGGPGPCDPCACDPYPTNCP